MNLKTDLSAAKKHIGDAIEDWALSVVDNMTAGKPKMQVAAVYMKNGIRNYIRWKSDELGSAIDGLAMFLGDEDGNIDFDKLTSDAISIIDEIDEQPFSMGFLGGTIGKGKIRIAIPDNILTRAVFGDTGAIALDASDIKSLFSLIDT